jgi:hypothetical protein
MQETGPGSAAVSLRLPTSLCLSGRSTLAKTHHRDAESTETRSASRYELSLAASRLSNLLNNDPQGSQGH